MRAPTADRMTPAELRAGVSLASIFALRMLGLFLILPVFSVFAQTLPGGDNLTLVGFALGAYGLTQALFQIVYGIASDRFGRKPVIAFGLVVFALGCLIAALAPDIWWMIAGRVLPVDEAVARTWGAFYAKHQRQGRLLSSFDSLLAATALAHDLTLATRNTTDFPNDVPVVNPWQ